MISRQFSFKNNFSGEPKSPKVSNSRISKPPAFKPLPSPEEKALMLAKARKLNATAAMVERKLNSK